MNNEDIAIVIGHDAMSKGAYSHHLKQSEYDYNRGVADIMGLDTYLHTPHYSYKQKMKRTYRKLSHYELTLEMHFNAAHERVQGVEALYFHTNQKGREIAKIYCEVFSKEYGIKNRGAKPLSNPNQRGYWAVASGIPTGLILEPFFGSNYECKPFADKERHAATMCEFISRI